VTPVALLAGALLAFLLLGYGLRRSAELFVLHVRAGRVAFVRGRMPQALLDDFAEVVRNPPLARARLSAVRRDGRATLVARGQIGEAQLQQLRNVLGQYPLQRILGGGRPGRRL